MLTQNESHLALNFIAEILILVQVAALLAASDGEL